ncbi:hypothetical protein HBA55_18180 [Pseudomaricurvus alkylphenolicus]|jgi:hypothetical protein|uniref:hypothetical protein n=1 Tax=Pseudomaricurvus alkylphenolicus TaxID=1306991 RepID=UPI00141DB8C9|nr:hypothetical protein [Pseudomaricurvus alkylphenolicus]NIB41537.1 hypothetical protein [Pseudomaricurvus alkylphenolicus]
MTRSKALVIAAERTDSRFVAGAVFLIACLLALLICAGATSVHAEKMIEADKHDDLFVPDRLNFYNPLKHTGSERKRYQPQNTALTNNQLETICDQIRNNEMSASQRALNYQWLEQDAEGAELHVGSKVVSKLVKMGLRTYWNGVHGKHYATSSVLPDGNGHGKFTEEVDYKIRLSGNKLKLSVKYEF